MESTLEATIDANEDASPEPKGDDDSEWRRLAMQFDGHRMQAIWHLKCLLIDPQGHKAAAEKFLSAGPLSGEKVLAARIKAIAAADNQDSNTPPLQGETPHGCA